MHTYTFSLSKYIVDKETMEMTCILALLLLRYKKQFDLVYNFFNIQERQKYIFLLTTNTPKLSFGVLVLPGEDIKLTSAGDVPFE